MAEIYEGVILLACVAFCEAIRGFVLSVNPELKFFCRFRERITTQGTLCQFYLFTRRDSITFCQCHSPLGFVSFAHCSL